MFVRAAPVPAAAWKQWHRETEWIVSDPAATFPSELQEEVQYFLVESPSWVGCCQRSPVRVMNPPVWSVLGRLEQRWAVEDDRWLAGPLYLDAPAD